MNSYLMTKEAEAVNSIPSKFVLFASSCLITSARWYIKCIEREIRRFLVCYQIFFGVLTVVTYKIYISQQYDFPCNIYKCIANTNSKHVLLMYRDKK